MGDWGGCAPLSLDPEAGVTPGVRCGWGLQSRNVTCVLFPSWPRLVTSDARCSGQSPPPGERLCAIRCGQDCQLGPWTAWTRCEGAPCGQPGAGGVTSRVRRVVTPPSGGGARCPPRVQRRQCWGARGRCGEQQGDNPVSLPLTARNSHVARVRPQSRQVTMYVGPWSNCSLTPDQDPSHGSRVVTRHSSDTVTRHVKTFTNSRQSLTSGLGQHPAPLSQSPGPRFFSPAPMLGQRTREVRCRGERGESETWSACMDGTRATVVPSDRQSCVMGRDCAVSEWGEWSEGPGGQVYCDISGKGAAGETRTRSVVSPAIGEGRPCPHLTEARPIHERRECKYR